MFYHLRGAITEPNFRTERINQRILLHQSGQGSSGGDTSMLELPPADFNADSTLNLEELFKNVLEDDRNQPDQSMQLQLDAFLIKRYFSKLE